MKLASIINLWDGVELLPSSMQTMKGHVDLFIIVYQDVSNFGEHYNPLSEVDLSQFDNIIIRKFEPEVGMGGVNERAKRNIGLDIAREHGCTHFLHADCDEFYENFGEAKELYLRSGKRGSVCRLFTYFKKPTLRFEHSDGYFVPFIHELHPETQAGVQEYPFYVDPTRRINESDVIELPFFMQHFSWVRKDIERKARNSSAKYRIEEGTMLQDYHDPAVGAGFFVHDYQQKLIEVPDKFNLCGLFTL